MFLMRIRLSAHFLFLAKSRVLEENQKIIENNYQKVLRNSK